MINVIPIQDSRLENTILKGLWLELNGVIQKKKSCVWCMRRGEYAFMFLDFKWIKYVCLLFFSLCKF